MKKQNSKVGYFRKIAEIFNNPLTDQSARPTKAKVQDSFEFL
jgi:hypothetical protein